MYGNNTSEADCCFHSIKPLYTDWWWGQAIFCGLAEESSYSWCVVGIVLYWSNAVGRLLSGIFERRTESVVKKRQYEQYKKKCGGGQADVSVTLSEGNFSGIRLFGILNFFLGGYRTEVVFLPLRDFFSNFIYSFFSFFGCPNRIAAYIFLTSFFTFISFPYPY